VVGVSSRSRRFPLREASLLYGLTGWLHQPGGCWLACSTKRTPVTGPRPVLLVLATVPLQDRRLCHFTSGPRTSTRLADAGWFGFFRWCSEKQQGFAWPSFAGRLVSTALIAQWKVAVHRAGHPRMTLGNVVALAQDFDEAHAGLQLDRPRPAFVMMGLVGSGNRGRLRPPGVCIWPPILFMKFWAPSPASSCFLRCARAVIASPTMLVCIRKIPLNHLGVEPLFASRLVWHSPMLGVLSQYSTSFSPAGLIIQYLLVVVGLDTSVVLDSNYISCDQDGWWKEPQGSLFDAGQGLSAITWNLAGIAAAAGCPGALRVWITAVGSRCGCALQCPLFQLGQWGRRLTPMLQKAIATRSATASALDDHLPAGSASHHGPPIGSRFGPTSHISKVLRDPAIPRFAPSTISASTVESR